MQKETRKNFPALACEDRFRMKLDAVHGERAMTQRHDLAVLALCGDLKALWKGTSLNDQRVIPASFKRPGQIGEEPTAGVPDRR